MLVDLDLQFFYIKLTLQNMSFWSLFHKAKQYDSSTGLTDKRDNAWLNSRLDYIWDNFFVDVAQENEVRIKFGRSSKYRLGSIRYLPKSKVSVITITGMFKKDSMPIEIVDQTIAHELCHYAHGFSSPKIRLHKYPHHGGIINKELRNRHLECLIKAYSAWVKEYRKTL